MERKQKVADVAEECEVEKMVKVTIIEESDDKIKILLADTDRALVNSIRRSLISDTPKMAIETVRFEMGTIEQEDQVWETTGPLPDEVIAQRLAMIPIPTRHEEFHFQHECPNCAELVEEDRGCPMCTMIYTCKAFGSKEGTMVTAKDLNYLGDSSLEIPELYKSIAITKLFNGQMVEFYATAIMGRGRDHAKWSPACGVAFEPRKIGIINNKTKAKILWDLKLGITAKDFSDGKLEDYFKVEELKSQLHHVGEGTEESRDFKDAITLEDIPGEFVLSFETDGSMTPRTAFNMAVKELAGKFNIIEQDTKAVL
ncbi:MAG: DNA-directed RNA polymerase subunit D [Candidatus Poseidoniales archaeon]|jgi:DNA-directed RNA polymerase subunit D|uniref:DNA-directed RNA polymerase subunit Rpo3 n=1 Tax=uncultured Poseidoniia archaeon TaxID=1697135 RepID=A0A1B1T9U6_9ARCH|nr:DNA-directed RNA polymerase subunit D (rpoD) [uncultured Candidatus Thalassoarchaea sp.]MAS18392.1 DNA-directed RNA polymerase subunit D [Euryarchaeota archaeon]MAV18758.1 DNA-directed RNA polymerase subunit D [Euryarchaeota archaeon]RCH74098.1 MAG: DNA-directed RNA polymerase subunit D [Candidatus Poseidoniales archaeon]